MGELCSILMNDVYIHQHATLLLSYDLILLWCHHSYPGELSMVKQNITLFLAGLDSSKENESKKKNCT
jgi:hypothetical protein